MNRRLTLVLPAMSRWWLLKPLRRSLLAALLVPLLTTTSLVAQDETGPLVHSSLSPEGEITVGQPVTMTVDLLVPSWMTGGPRFPEIEVEDAVVIFLERGGFNLSERIGGETWSGLRRQYLIYALRPGPFEIAGEEVVVRYSVDGKPSPPTPVSIPGVGFSATVPEAAAGLDYFVSASQFDLSSIWDRPVEGVKVGQSLTRTVEMKAVDSFAMMLPPLEFVPVDGLAVYPDAPQLSDTGGERGAVRVSRRVERVTYLFQEPGIYTLLPIEVSWWDAEDGRLHRSRLPEVELEVAPNPGLEAEIPLAPEESAGAAATAESDRGREALRAWFPALLVIAVLLWMGRRWWRIGWPGLRDSLAEWRQRHEESEAAYFRRFREACRGADPSRAYRDLIAWLDRAGDDCGAATLSELVKRSADPRLAQAVADLERHLFGARVTAAESQAERWRSGELYSRVARARHKLSGTVPETPQESEALPPLNP